MLLQEFAAASDTLVSAHKQTRQMISQQSVEMPQADLCSLFRRLCCTEPAKCTGLVCPTHCEVSVVTIAPVPTDMSCPAVPTICSPCYLQAQVKPSQPALLRLFPRMRYSSCCTQRCTVLLRTHRGRAAFSSLPAWCPVCNCPRALPMTLQSSVPGQ